MTKVKTMKINDEKVPRSKKSTKKSKYPTQAEAFKLEIASELGLLEKVKKCGWDSLSSEESGRLGGLVTKRKKSMQLNT
ncbi:alpha/beta-type small acid-soluble spore protein [Metallumcola ferriviriculae]|uniref:Alpha/beta-type small acid-soluble spore protein n=1 Tax=Metallumcola ferriviriculae TaxID=3039180 RepID=A0AAU0US29_9FIRM|nr:alpha/beta-type small acid-soluble spore protein [Desulfitibacteraceae bacterium MK1]